MIKKLNALLAALLIVAASYMQAFAAGTATDTLTENGTNGYVWTITFAGDSPSVAMSASKLLKVKGLYLYQVATNPGGTTSDNWDIVILNTDGMTDVLGSQCLDRDTTASEVCYPNAFYFVDAPLTLTISGASATAAGTVKVFFVK